MATKLVLERLDERTLPNATLPISVPPIIIDPIMPIDPVVPVLSHHTLHGKGEANFVVSAPIPDAGITYSLSGTTHLHGLGSFTLSGSIQTIGFIMDGHATGDIVLTNSQGTISISLKGPMQVGFSAPPSRFSYTITGGTGAYANMTGSGVLQDHFIYAPTAVGQPEQGIVELKFS